MGDDWDTPRQGSLGGGRSGPPDRRPGRSAPRPPEPRREPRRDDPADVLEPKTARVAEPPPVGPENRGATADEPPARRGRGRRVGMVAGAVALSLVSLLVLGVTGYAWTTLQSATTNIRRSGALASPDLKKSLNGDTNILIMGLDSRLDENGNPLPQDIYDALHAGDNSNGGNNANVLMLLHVPVQGRAVEISIPRDDYVTLPGAPDGVTKEKIKQAYGLAFDQQYNKLRAQGVTDKATLQQQSRDAGRHEQALTVSQFLGGVSIDHFVEVTLVAFYQIAQVVQPVTVCLTDRTQDTYSGANFQAGKQPISAAQAVAFVRQRRDNVPGDPNYNDFTDLDRERRQQAFIASLAYQLKQAGTFTDPAKISGILDIAKQNTAIDSGLNLLEFAQEASNLTGGNIQFNTLPVASFAHLDGPGDVNMVNVPQIQGIVRSLIGAPTPPSGSAAAATSTSAAPVPPGVVDAVNDGAGAGTAGQVEQALAAKGFTQGTATTGGTTVKHTVVEYGSSGAASAANAVATLLDGVTVRRSTAVSPGHVRVVLGADFTMPTALAGGVAVSSSAAAPAATQPAAPPAGSAPATGSGSATAPNPLAGGGVPCVR